MSTVTLTGKEGGTLYEAQFKGLAPDAQCLINLHGGSCAQRGASFTRVSEISSDEKGSSRSSGKLLFRDQDAIEPASIADGAHIIVVQSIKAAPPRHVAACGAVPAPDD